MSTYKGNAGHLMQHWTLCELLVAARKHTSGLNFIDAHAMAPLARVREEANRRFDIVQQRVQVCLPDPNLTYEYAWHNLDPNGEGYPNSAAFVEQVWEGDFSLLLCEICPLTIAELEPWLERVDELPRCTRTELFPGDWRQRFERGLPIPSEMGLPDGSLTLVSFDPDMYYTQSPHELNPRNLYPCDLKRVLAALKGVKGGVIIQLSTYSRGHRNEAPQDAVIDSVDAILAASDFERCAVVRLNGNMMSLVYARNVSWSAELADLPVRFNEWLNGN